MSLADRQTRERIRELNDAFRKSHDPRLGKVMLTAGVAGLSSEARAIAIETTRNFDAFTGDNDPHGEHDFGSFEVAGNKFFFKLDYYDRNLEFGSDDPADPAKTARVLTIMFSEEY
jgi:hypothetical protein